MSPSLIESSVLAPENRYGRYGLAVQGSDGYDENWVDLTTSASIAKAQQNAAAS